MDLISIFLMVLFVIGIFAFPSSMVSKIETKIGSKLVSKQSKKYDVIDIEKISKNIS